MHIFELVYILLALCGLEKTLNKNNVLKTFKMYAIQTSLNTSYFHDIHAHADFM